MTRRALLAGGAAALVAGCGADDPAPYAPAAEAIAAAGAAEARAGEALARLGAPAAALRDHARERRVAVSRLAAGGRPPETAPVAGGPEGAATALAAALEAHVAALASVPDPGGRGVLADLIAGAAGDLAVLRAEFGLPAPDDSFPGSGA